MGNSKTQEEVKQERLKVLGKEFGTLYDLIYNDYLWLSAYWKEYKELYGTKESRIDLLNRAAPFFFYVIREVLYENIFLGICKLTDPPMSAGRRNASIGSLLEFIIDPDFKVTVKTKTDEILASSKPIRIWRNRQITHRDRFIATDLTADPLKEVTRKDIDSIMKKLSEYLNLFQYHYFKSHTDFEVVDNLNGSLALLHIIDEGLESRQKRIARLNSGKFSDDDLRNKEI